jgi:opacity protein-like surface antigen
MKKILLVTALLSVFGAAQAIDLGITGGRDYATPHSNDYGITVGQQLGKFSVTGEVESVKHVGLKEVRYDLIGGYDLYSFKGNTLTAKVGGAYIKDEGVKAGYAGLVGAGLTIPVTKNVALTADYRYQQAQKRIDTYTGNSVTAGIKVSF